MGLTHLITALVLSLPHLKPSALTETNTRSQRATFIRNTPTNFIQVWRLYLKHTRSLLRLLRSTSWRQSSRQQLSSWRWSELMSNEVTFPWAGSSWTQLTVLDNRAALFEHGTVSDHWKVSVCFCYHFKSFQASRTAPRRVMCFQAW